MLKSKIELFVPHEIMVHKGSNVILPGSIVLPVFPIDIYANIENKKVTFIEPFYQKLLVLILRKGKTGKKRLKSYKIRVPTLVPKSGAELFLDLVCKSEYTILRKIETPPFDVITSDSYTFLYMTMAMALFITRYPQMTTIFAKDSSVLHIYDNINDIINSHSLDELDELSGAINARFGDKRLVWQELQLKRVLLGKQKNLDHVYNTLIQMALEAVLAITKVPLKKRSILCCKRALKAIQAGKGDNLPTV